MSAPQLCENDRGEWKLFIKNLPWSADDDMVWTEFGAAGEVCYARVCTEQGRPAAAADSDSSATKPRRKRKRRSICSTARTSTVVILSSALQRTGATWLPSLLAERLEATPSPRRMLRVPEG